MGYVLLLVHPQLRLFCAVPNFVPTQTLHRIKYGIF